MILVFKAILPQSIKNTLLRIKVKIGHLKSNIKVSISNFKKKVITKYHEVKLKFFLAIDRFINYSHQKEFNKLVLKLKLYLTKTPPNEHLKNSKVFLKNITWKVVTIFKKLSSSQNFVRAFSVVLIALGSYGIYFSTQDIYKSENPMRAPASVQEYDYRPDYKTFQSRTLKVMNVKIPVEVESVREIDSITVDFSIRTTTRFARLFLENYEYKLKDYFFTTVEPIISDFPIKEEGKDILKEKLTEEVNNFLRENGVEGEVEEVEIVFIVAS